MNTLSVKFHVITHLLFIYTSHSYPSYFLFLTYSLSSSRNFVLISPTQSSFLFSPLLYSFLSYLLRVSAQLWVRDEGSIGPDPGEDCGKRERHPACTRHVTYSNVQCGIAQYVTMQCSIVQTVVQCSTVQYIILQYSTVKYPTLYHLWSLSVAPSCYLSFPSFTLSFHFFISGITLSHIWLWWWRTTLLSHTAR